MGSSPRCLAFISRKARRRLMHINGNGGGNGHHGWHNGSGHHKNGHIAFLVAFDWGRNWATKKLQWQHVIGGGRRIICIIPHLDDLEKIAPGETRWICSHPELLSWSRKKSVVTVRLRRPVNPSRSRAKKHEVRLLSAFFS